MSTIAAMALCRAPVCVMHNVIWNFLGHQEEISLLSTQVYSGEMIPAQHFSKGVDLPCSGTNYMSVRIVEV